MRWFVCVIVISFITITSIVNNANSFPMAAEYKVSTNEISFTPIAVRYWECDKLKYIFIDYEGTPTRYTYEAAMQSEYIHQYITVALKQKVLIDIEAKDVDKEVKCE